MKTAKTVIWVVFALLLASQVSASTYNYDNPGNAGMKLTSQDLSGVEIRYTVEKLRLESKDVDGNPMTSVRIPGVFLPNEPGAPNLPGQARMIAIPQGATASFQIISTDTEVISNIDIAPAETIPIDSDDTPPICEKNASIYSKNENYPQSPVELSTPKKIRGVDFVKLRITPFQYNPVTKELLVYHNIQVRVSFNGGNGHFGDNRLRSRHWEPILQAHLVNYQSLPEVDFNYPPSMSTDTTGCEYLIIVPDDAAFIAWADSIVTWRKLQGISSAYVTLTDIGGNTVSAIEDYIDDAYNNWGIPPSAILILSDMGATGLAYGITSPSYSGNPADNTWADIDGDYLPEISIARICARDNNELTTIVGKFLNYERHPPIDPGFYQYPVSASGWDSNKWFIMCSEICRGYLENVHGKDASREYVIYSGTPDTLWSTHEDAHLVVDYFGPNGHGYIPATPEHLNDWTGTAEGVNSSINNGAFWVIQRDHSWTNHWWSPSYYISDIAGLTNLDLPVIINLGCGMGTFQSSGQSLMEAFHRTQYGALCQIAATGLTYSYCNDTYNWGLYDYCWPDFDTGYGLTTPYNVNLCFANSSAKFYLDATAYPLSSGQVNATFHLWHYFGDAFNSVHFEIPEDMLISHPSVMFSGTTEFMVTAEAGALIGLTVDGEIIGVGTGTGSAVAITVDPQLPNNTLVVTATLQNRFRYSSTVNIIPPEGYGVIDGFITDLVTGDSLQGLVTVTNVTPAIEAHGGTDGYYWMYVPADSMWDIRAEYNEDYLPAFTTTSVAENESTHVNFALEPKVDILLRASFGNPADIAYREFYIKGSWNDDGFYDPAGSEVFIPIKDDGVAPDAVAGDGIYSGTVKLATDLVNTYGWAVYCENYNDEASRLQYGTSFQITNPGTPPTVPVLSVNPAGSQHNYTLTARDLSGVSFDFIPGYNGQPHVWYGSIFIPGGYTSNMIIEVMGSDQIVYGVGGIGGPRYVFTVPEDGVYDVYFSDIDDFGSAGANLTILPSYLDVTLEPGMTATRDLVLSNDGVLPLNFAILDDFGPKDLTSENGERPDPEPFTSYEYHFDKTNVEETPQEPPVTLDVGGPDKYGYKWIDSNEPGGPTFDWVDIQYIGTPLNMSDDDNQGPFEIPFDFNYYGIDYKSFRVCSNGFISFTSTSAAYSNTTIPGSGPENLLAMFWDDLNPSASGDMYYYISEDSAIVSWVEVPHYNELTYFTMQIILLKGGTIVYQYLGHTGRPEDASPTIGIQDSTLKDGLEYCYGSGCGGDSLTIKFSAGWMDVSQLDGIIPIGGQTTVTAMFDAGALNVGDYIGDITVTSWDNMKTLPDISIPVDLHVVSSLGPLDLTMRPAVSPVIVPPGGSFDYALTITNNTGGPYSYTGWTMVELPSHNFIGPIVLGSSPIGTDVTHYIYPTLQIPMSAGAGSYAYWSYVGTYPSGAVDEASFPFEITSTVLNSGVTDWNVLNYYPQDMRQDGWNNLPVEYSLSQSYPNPFNSSATIDYTVPVAGSVELDVYNLMGQRVTKLVNEYKQPGYHSVTWNAASYSSGVYFYTLKAGEKIFTKRMTLLK
ncbi:MAG: T9SS type A sorting domain-containing protein [candidate division Zixibacteria bacterium]|nr:T9SS type A sorting domain-containing protein [candidate division Zixibacteria bacterium]